MARGFDDLDPRLTADRAGPLMVPFGRTEPVFVADREQDRRDSGFAAAQDDERAETDHATEDDEAETETQHKPSAGSEDADGGQRHESGAKAIGPVHIQNESRNGVAVSRSVATVPMNSTRD